jgi:hypothetical protein
MGVAWIPNTSFSSQPVGINGRESTHWATVDSPRAVLELHRPEFEIVQSVLACSVTINEVARRLIQLTKQVESID